MSQPSNKGSGSGLRTGRVSPLIAQALRLAEEIRDLWMETVEKAKGDEGKEARLPEQALPVAEKVAVPTTSAYDSSGRKKDFEPEPSGEEPPSVLNITG